MLFPLQLQSEEGQGPAGCHSPPNSSLLCELPFLLLSSEYKQTKKLISFFFFTLHVLSGHSCLTTLWKLRFTLSLDPQTPGPTDSWHRHGSWCEINGRTPVWTKKLELRLFKPLVPANYQPMEVTGEKGTSSRHCKVAIDCTKTVMSALWQMTQVFQQTSNLKGEERLL